MPTVLLYALGAVNFILAILLSIGLHEFGHLYFAKRFGAKVTQYFIGFGPTVWSTQRGETEYGLKAIPLGGFVRIIGMMPPVKGHFEKLNKTDEPGQENQIVLRSTNTGLFTGLVANAKQSEYETIDPKDEHRLFYRLTWWRKFIVMAAGPAVNLILAFLFFLGVFAIYGQTVVRPVEGPPIVGQVVNCAVGQYATPAETCKASEKSPAYLAGLLEGDKIVELAGTPITSWDQFTDLVQKASATNLALKVERDGETVMLEVTPKLFLRPDDSANGKTVSQNYIGIAPEIESVRERHGPLFTLNYMGDRTVETFRAFAQIPAKVKNVTLAIVGVEKRDPNGPVSIVGGARFSGEVASYKNGDVPGLEISWADKLAGFFMLIAGFNLFLGLLNGAVPVLPLDAGHMFGAVWEGVKNGFARLAKRPKPLPVDVSKALPLAYAFGLTLFLLGMVLIVGDLVVPIKLFG